MEKLDAETLSPAHLAPSPADSERGGGFSGAMNTEIAQTKTHRKNLDAILQEIRRDSDKDFTGERSPDHVVRSSRERSQAITKIQEGIMWLGMDLKAINEAAPGTAPNPYPESYNPTSPAIEPTADGIKL